jgi:NADPH-dependent dioxygenase
VIPDGDGRVSDRLGLSPGGWLLVRPDSYLLARGPALSPAALSDALGRLPLARPV